MKKSSRSTTGRAVTVQQPGLDVTIGGQKYLIEPLGREIDVRGPKNRTMVLVGQIDHDELWLRLTVHPSQKTRIAETLLHEILHGVSSDRHLNLSENLVSQIASGLYGVMALNPHIFGTALQEYCGQLKNQTKAVTKKAD